MAMAVMVIMTWRRTWTIDRVMSRGLVASDVVPTYFVSTLLYFPVAFPRYLCNTFLF